MLNWLKNLFAPPAGYEAGCALVHEEMDKLYEGDKYYQARAVALLSHLHAQAGGQFNKTNREDESDRGVRDTCNELMKAFGGD